MARFTSFEELVRQAIEIDLDNVCIGTPLKTRIREVLLLAIEWQKDKTSSGRDITLARSVQEPVAKKRKKAA